MLVYVDDITARCTHLSLTDEQAEEIIEAAAQCAADQIRTECRRRRLAEKHNMDLQEELAEEQRQNAANVAAHRERELAESNRRNAALAAAEQIHGPKRGHSGSAW